MLVFNKTTGDFEMATDGDPLDKTIETPPLTLEEITRAEAGNAARWGAATFHNLEAGARASGNVTSAHSLLCAADLEWDPGCSTDDPVQHQTLDRGLGPGEAMEPKLTAEERRAIAKAVGAEAMTRGPGRRLTVEQVRASSGRVRPAVYGRLGARGLLVWRNGWRPVPPCAAAMGCLCAGHARGNPASSACDTTEQETPNGP